MSFIQLGQAGVHSYSLGVALFDFVPVLVAAGGFALLARGIAARHHALAVVAWLGAALIPLGGLCKASWKLIVATQQREIPWLENLLFIAMAPGFAVLSFSLFHARRAWQSGVAPATAGYPAARLLLWLALPLLGALAAAIAMPESRAWFFCLLAATTIANAALLLQAALAARWASLSWPVQLSFFYNFAATLALAGLSRLLPGETTAWIQEAVNLSAQAALAYGLWRLSLRMRSKP